MLVLTRRPGGKVIIYNRETMEVLGEVYNLSSGTCAIGFKFPMDVDIAREEIYEAHLRELKQTAQAKEDKLLEMPYFDGASIKTHVVKKPKIEYKTKSHNIGC